MPLLIFNKKKHRVLIILLYAIFAYSFFRYNAIPGSLRKIITLATVISTLIYLVPTIFGKLKSNVLGKYIRALLFLLLFSIIQAFIFHGQSPIESTIITIYDIGGVLFYFVLVKLKPTLKETYKFISIMVILHIILWIFGMAHFPEDIYTTSSDKNLDISRGIMRISLAAKPFLVLGLFIILEKAIIFKKKQYWIFVAAISTLIVLEVIRQVIFLSAILSIYIFIRKKRYSLIIIAIITMLLIGIFQFVEIGKKTIVGKMLALTERQSSFENNSEENIRITAYRYFFTEKNSNIFTVLLGNGYPHSNSKYGYRMFIERSRLKLFASDVGYAYIFIRLGLIGLIVFLLIFLQAKKVRNVPISIRIFVLYMYLLNIATAFILVDFFALACSLYIIDLHHNLNKANELFPSNYNTSI
ncbi:hypothetical protein [Saccharicrinis aurantiacus]|uniref:hypothetical protein n=1 Tax=Saccharicrinis aurantiacus TaxID=1849719 RepID=UPI0024929E1E|nr:hypothetical protein [Saccharicrinis aurantiacus]